MLELRYGLGTERPCTFDEVGRTFNVTRERIRQIEHQALKKLQTIREAQKLRVTSTPPPAVRHARSRTEPRREPRCGRAMRQAGCWRSSAGGQ